MTSDREILKQIIEKNREGLERLAKEEPAEERRNALKKLKSRLKSLLSREEKVGHVTA